MIMIVPPPPPSPYFLLHPVFRLTTAVYNCPHTPFCFLLIFHLYHISHSLTHTHTHTHPADQIFFETYQKQAFHAHYLPAPLPPQPN